MTEKPLPLRLHRLKLVKKFNCQELLTRREVINYLSYEDMLLTGEQTAPIIGAKQQVFSGENQCN